MFADEGRKAKKKVKEFFILQSFLTKEPIKPVTSTAKKKIQRAFRVFD